VNDKVNVLEKLASFDERWRPRIVAKINDHAVILVKLRASRRPVDTLRGAGWLRLDQTTRKC
jgi:hypothetical protein